MPFYGNVHVLEIMKLLTAEEFNDLELPSSIDTNVIEACRYVFVIDMPLITAARTCGINHPQGMLDLFNTMELIIHQIEE